MSLTTTQQAILALIAERIEIEGLPPSQTEISHAFGFKSVRAAQYHLEALERDGAIQRMPGRARGIRLMRAPPMPQGELKLSPVADDMGMRVPVLGRVAAGAPIGSAADAQDDDCIVLDRNLFHPVPDCLLRVEGDSMRDEGIFDGDLVGVQRTEQARSGEIVVARVDGEITIKRLELAPTSIRLLPANPEYAPITVGADAEFAVEGLYCGLLRPNRAWPR